MSACVVLLIDESAAMGTAVARDPNSPLAASAAKSKAESIATAINSLLNKLSKGPNFDVALVGYRSDGDGNVEVGSRWKGSLAGRDFVATSELAAAPVSVEQRTRRVPGAGGMLEEQTVEFPVWYESELGDKAPQVAAFNFCSQLLADWSAQASSGSNPPLVINITAGSSGDGNPLRAIQAVQQLQLPGGAAPVVMQAHLGSANNVPPTLYPANRAYLTIGPMRDLFERVSELPASIAARLKENRIAINPKARGMIYNARMADVVQFLSLAQMHTQDWESAPPATIASEAAPAPDAAGAIDQADETSADEQLDVIVPIDEPAAADASADFAGWKVTPEEPALIVFVLDRSVADPFGGNLQNSCAKLQEQMGDLVEQIVKIGEGAIDVGVISYGVDGMGEPEVRVGLEGGLAGRPYARDNELEAGAARLDEFQEDIPNGIGGLISIPHRRPVLVEVEPTDATPPAPAFSEVAQLVSAWRAASPASSMPPIVLHLTRGKLDAADVQAGAAQLRADCGGDVALYHLIATEEEHPKCAYPSDPAELADPGLQALWEASSVLLCADQIAEENASVNTASRGLVVNGKFNLLLDAVKRVKDL